MFTHSPFIYILSSLALVASSSRAQIPQVSRSDVTQRQVFTPELATVFQKSLNAGGVPGMAATAVFANDSSNPQFATYGNRTEDGDAVEKEVCYGGSYFSSQYANTLLRHFSSLDHLRKVFSRRLWAFSWTTLRREKT